MIICDTKLMYSVRKDGRTEIINFNVRSGEKIIEQQGRVGEGGTFSSSEFGANSFLVFPLPFFTEKGPLCKTQRQQNPFVKNQDTSDKYVSKAKELSWQLC